MRQKLKALPRSTAKTAWELCVDVKRAIREEPKRANMRTFRRRLTPERGGPACGYVGCFAGWVCVLRGKKRGVDDFAARDILGCDLQYILASSNMTPFGVFNHGAGDACDTTNPGTRAHARAVIARINRFMQVNEAALKAKVL